MGSRILLAFCTLSALLLTTLQARLDPFSHDDHRLLLSSRAALVQNPEPEKGIADPPEQRSSAEKPDEEGKGSSAEAPAEGERHHSTDKSIAGGGVIIGGLVTAIFAAVYCYIRVTRKQAAQTLK